ncbi:MAG: 4-aminobutyrate--2-oxoglutarate transaminase [Syntrophomonadaceae bacterium]|nr:4-aminobutyrate--2-oxoglutarate transaminase [Syntrophomonadaceae bacterium]
MDFEWKPQLLTEIPGPKSKELLALREKYVSRGLANNAPIFVEEAKGALVRDVDGNIFIDFAAGIGVVNVGHSPKEIVDAVKEQAEKFLHTCFHVAMYEPYVRLAEKLTQITPGSFPKKVMLANSGAEAVENAVKLARKHSKRTGIISLECAFHGRTLMAMTLTSKVKPYKFGFGPFAPEIYKIPSAYCYRCIFGRQYPGCDLQCVSYLERFFLSECPHENVAAIIMEPVQGEGGFIAPPPEYLKGLKAVCEKYGILLIADEVQSGFGRTGRMFAVEHFGIEPDMMTLSKSLAAGMPVSAVVGRAEIMDAASPGEIGSTFGGNPVSCVAALKSIELLERDSLADRSYQLGEIMIKRLKHMQDKYPLIGDVRGIGAMVAIELVKDRQTKEPAKEAALKVVRFCVNSGVLALSAGVFSNVIRFLVPLVITEEQLSMGLDVVDRALEAASFN